MPLGVVESRLLSTTERRQLDACEKRSEGAQQHSKIEDHNKVEICSWVFSRCQRYRFVGRSEAKLLETGAVGRVQGYKKDQQESVQEHAYSKYGSSSSFPAQTKHNRTANVKLKRCMLHVNVNV